MPVRCGHLWICDGASATIDPRPAIRPHVTETATAMLATAPPEQVRALLEPLGTGAFVIGVAPDGRLGFVALNRRHGALTGVAPGAAAGIGEVLTQVQKGVLEPVWFLVIAGVL